MHIFKDREGKDWTVDVNVDSLRRVRSMIQVDMMELVSNPEFIEKLVGDPCLLVNVVYVLCKPQADAASISDEDFGRRMAGDAIENATTALLEDFVDFFPTRKRGILQSALAKLKLIESRMMDLAEQAINDPRMEVQIETALAKLSASNDTALAA